ncbi:MAG: chorismate synthase [Spirochaetota bacterium]
MPGSTIGCIFRVTTFGESHGAGVGAVVDGVPPGLPLCEGDIQKELDRRRPGQSSVTSPRQEADRVEILSGVFEGRTTGTPVALLIHNRDVDSSDYRRFKDKLRPGHADYTYLAKYGLRDWRGSGRASGRETAARVAAGAVARKLLAERGVTVSGYAAEIGGVAAGSRDLQEVERNPVRAPDPEAAARMVERIERARAEQDSVGGVVEVVVRGLPPGLGEPVFDKLEARLAHAVMSIGAVRGFEVGAGFAAARMKGSEFNDPYCLEEGAVRTRTNNAGGVLGGISTGEELLFRAAVRPPASIGRRQRTVSVRGKETTVQVGGRHDPCIVPRVVPVVEAMTAIILIDLVLELEARRPDR